MIWVRQSRALGLCSDYTALLGILFGERTVSLKIDTSHAQLVLGRELTSAAHALTRSH